MKAEVLDKHPTNYFDTSNAAEKNGQTLLSTKAFMELVAPSIQLKTDDSIAASFPREKNNFPYVVDVSFNGKPQDGH